MMIRSCYACLLAVATLTLAGCGGRSAPVSDPKAAVALLGSSLEAWKTGKSVADMRQLTPPVYVADELWSDGFELRDFVIEGDGEMYGPNVRLSVTLTGSSRGGAVGKKQFQYLVTTTPACTIARADR
ncbi:hypothetical protein [Allorhodopirellula heiligendammensis]|uniref:Lipoprotein n=1 Tax=Allorhodopirellula heiligendammensis TaxID=2714739 RepID=A0A5C6C682_9BACT|nr:hypothetical protein [Allorhodopirellula heiligendammensis]TWU18884.1 hypothetical protein Poly21_10550 [Allorhodopirellula heiligendammensis]